MAFVVGNLVGKCTNKKSHVPSDTFHKCRKNDQEKTIHVPHRKDAADEQNVFRRHSMILTIFVDKREC